MRMYLRCWILLATLLAIASATTEIATSEKSEKQPTSQELVRQKRFLFTSALLAAKTLMTAGAYGLGLTSGALISGGTLVPVYIHHPYPVYRTVHSPPYSYGHGWYN